MKIESYEFRGRLQTAVLFIIFNRPETTARVFDMIRRMRPPRLYVAADGPRKGRIGESELTIAARNIATNVDWECELKLKLRPDNLGCRMGVSQAISWFFETELQGIILEDDCLPDESFFWFCESLLQRYAYDTRVFAINGTNFQEGHIRGQGSYYFSKYPHIWGWATWRRVWNLYDVEMRFWDCWKASKSWKNYFNDSVIRRYWTVHFDSIRNGEIDTWDYQFVASTLFHNGLVATPNINLVTNIGFGDNATHTTQKNSRYANRKSYCMSSLTHPDVVQADDCADLFDFNNLFGGYRRRGVRGVFFRMKSLIARVARFLKGFVGSTSHVVNRIRRR